MTTSTSTSTSTSGASSGSSAKRSNAKSKVLVEMSGNLDRASLEALRTEINTLARKYALQSDKVELKDL